MIFLQRGEAQVLWMLLLFSGQLDWFVIFKLRAPYFQFGVRPGPPPAIPQVHEEVILAGNFLGPWQSRCFPKP
jgi:hypothetical protein